MGFLHLAVSRRKVLRHLSWLSLKDAMMKRWALVHSGNPITVTVTTMPSVFLIHWQAFGWLLWEKVGISLTACGRDEQVICIWHLSPHWSPGLTEDCPRMEAKNKLGTVRLRAFSRVAWLKDRPPKPYTTFENPQFSSSFSQGTNHFDNC